MNFFEHQHQAKKNSKRLVVLFTLAVIAIVIAIYFPVQFAMAKYYWPRNMIKDHPVIWNFKLFGYVSLITLGVIVVASWMKIRELAEGGIVIAHMMNGRLVEPETQDFKERQLLNVVDEMALASGIPSPNVYMMDNEFTINAFAAGYTTGDAVIGVTRGTVDKLSRDELQGVIGHEFSHILNGDMRLNIKLLGLLHGILVIAIIGRAMLSGTSSGSRRRGKGSGPFIAIGLALMIIGWIGHLFGKLIQAAVSRQREFLADASAVQFTRNADGIGSALKKIGGYKGVPATGSHLLTANRSEIAHMTFANVNFASMFGLTSSHPPIEKRIAAIDRGFRPEREKRIEPLPHVITNSSGMGVGEIHARKIRIDNLEIPVSENLKYTAGAIAGLVGTIPMQAVNQQKVWLESLPEAVLNACHNCIKARSVIYILLSEFNESALDRIKNFLKLRDAHALETFSSLWTPIKTLGPEARLRLVDLCIPALRKLSADEYKLFIQNMIDLIKMDENVSLFEFLIMKVVKKHLSNHKNPQKPRHITINDLSKVDAELKTLLSVLNTQLDNPPLNELDQALKKLSHTTFPIRQQVMEACAQTALADQQVTWKERELLRAIGDTLDCPVPAIN